MIKGKYLLRQTALFKYCKQVVKRIGIGSLIVLVDSLDEAHLLQLPDYQKALRKFVKEFMYDNFLAVGGLIFFFPDTQDDLVGDKFIRERGRLDRYNVIDVSWSHNHITWLIEQKFKKAQMSSIPDGNGKCHSFGDFMSQLPEKDVQILFANLKTPRHYLLVFKNLIVRLQSRNEVTPNLSDLEICVKEVESTKS